MDLTTGLLIAILSVVVLIALGIIEVYRKTLAIFRFYGPESPPPASLRFGGSFLTHGTVDKQSPVTT